MERNKVKQLPSGRPARFEFNPCLSLSQYCCCKGSFHKAPKSLENVSRCIVSSSGISWRAHLSCLVSEDARYSRSAPTYVYKSEDHAGTFRGLTNRRPRFLWPLGPLSESEKHVAREALRQQRESSRFARRAISAILSFVIFSFRPEVRIHSLGLAYPIGQPPFGDRPGCPLLTPRVDDPPPLAEGVGLTRQITTLRTLRYLTHTATLWCRIMETQLMMLSGTQNTYESKRNAMLFPETLQANIRRHLI